MVQATQIGVGPIVDAVPDYRDWKGLKNAGPTSPEKTYVEWVFFFFPCKYKNSIFAISDELLLEDEK